MMNEDWRGRTRRATGRRRPERVPPADRREDRGAGRLAGRNPRPGPDLIEQTDPEVGEEWKWRGLPARRPWRRDRRGGAEGADPCRWSWTPPRPA